MPGFGIAFNTAAHALSAIQLALTAVQNNVVNASTPGYAAERVNFSASGFEPAQGLTGGLEVHLSSTRDEYLERSVRSEMSALGALEQVNPLLASLQNAFNVSGDSGIPGALSTFAGNFATLGASPNDASARAGVIEAGQQVVNAFNQTAARIGQVGAEATAQAASTVTEINQLTTHIAALNAAIEQGAKNDAGIAADLNDSLDRLSELVDVTTSIRADGTTSVLLGGQTALVLGSTAYQISLKPKTGSAAAAYPGGDAGIQLLDQSGADITGQATGGKLAGLLHVRNQTLAYYLGNQTQPGVLNSLAKTFASRVNTIITGAQTVSGTTVMPLFVLPADDTSTSSALTLSAISANQIVANDASSSNGSALALAGIDSSSNPLDLINGQSFTGFYGEMAGRAGSEAARSASDLATQQDLTTQAQNQRSQASGVSLNDQAAQLLSLQQAYQATARIITILDNISQTAVNLIPQV
jgi:flagellar hook-associated protein 1 FlgK